MTALACTLVAGSVVLGSAAALLVPIGESVASGAVSARLPVPELRPLALRSVVYDRDGNQMAVLHSGQNRAPVDLEDVAPALVDAVLAAEDRDFYEHDGVDWRGVSRALLRNLDAGSIEQGGSTITQQLVKNTMFEDPERDLDRKVKEAVLAIALEDRYDKHQILEQYLNTIYLGNGAYGVRAAAERYFASEPAELSLAEAALLAGMIANPEGRDPIDRPDAALRARNSVLDDMVDAGSATAAEVAGARREPLPVELQALEPSPVTDPFVEEVKRRLLRDPRLGETPQERYRRVFEGGLRIHTTSDLRMQVVAELAVRNIMPPDVPYTAALVAIDNRDGSVRAMVPGTSFSHAGFNLATQGARQTGSSFKPFTFAAAIEAGFSPEDTVDASGECEFELPGSVEPWRVQNYDGRSQGTLTLRDAMAKSSNCAYARLVQAVGPAAVVDVAHRLGIERDLEAVPSITLGTQPVSPLEMTSAFSTFATEGVRHEPRFVDRVEARDGSVIFEERPDPEQAVTPEVARTVTEALGRVVTNGTGTAARLDRPAAGKTGTNQAYRDAWFVGYTPQITAGVWIGNADAQVPIEIGGRRVTGGSQPARIWHDFMAAASEGMPVVAFNAPDPLRWPRATRISELGRVEARVRRAPAAPVEVPETVPAPTTEPAPEGSRPPKPSRPPTSPPPEPAPTTDPPAPPPTTAPPPPPPTDPPTTPPPTEPPPPETDGG